MGFVLLLGLIGRAEWHSAHFNSTCACLACWEVFWKKLSRLWPLVLFGLIGGAEWHSEPILLELMHDWLAGWCFGYK